MPPAFLPFIKTDGLPCPKLAELEEKFTTECDRLISRFRKSPVSCQRILDLIEILNTKAEALQKEKLVIWEVAEREPAIPTIEEIVPKWIQTVYPPSIASSSCGSGTQRATPVDPIRQASKTYEIPDHLPKRPFYLPVIGNPNLRMYYFGARDAYEAYARFDPWDTFGPPGPSIAAGSGRQLRFAELPTHFVEEQAEFSRRWEMWEVGRRVEAWCGDVERHRGRFTNPNIPTEEEKEAEGCVSSCPWWDNLDYARMEDIDRDRYPGSFDGFVTGPPVLIQGQSEISSQLELMDNDFPDRGIVVRPSELHKHLDQLTERLERRMEQLVGEVRAAAAGRTNFTSPPVTGGSPSVQVGATDTPAAQGCDALAGGREPSVYGFSDSGGSQGPNLWVYTPAMTEGGGSSFCRPSESEPVSIIDCHDDRHLRLGFPPLVPAIMWGTCPSEIPPQSAWSLREATIVGDDLIAL
ncbi:hypothetical protein TWF481_006443 [Arthrobotrys musiformis]|uniref:Uncharacterized protein n=1 Tax=Arthrobotrys musiformis TaxID=47236 RepID=A0AAV9WGS8_9PEZI